MVLVAIAREYGVTERGRQVALLASVLCGRDISTPDVDAESGAALPTDPDERKKSLFRGIWDAAKLLRAVDDEFEKRPPADGAVPDARVHPGDRRTGDLCR